MTFDEALYWSKKLRDWNWSEPGIAVDWRDHDIWSVSYLESDGSRQFESDPAVMELYASVHERRDTRRP